MGTEYLTQVEQLRAAYRYALASCKERHQMADIEQLQLLCDKVLNSMDQWHRRYSLVRHFLFVFLVKNERVYTRRTIQQMRQTHAHEVEQLRQEKEQALAEETQATLAALDAMRKAHVAEVNALTLSKHLATLRLRRFNGRWRGSSKSTRGNSATKLSICPNDYR